MVIDKELILPKDAVLHVTGVADVDVEPAVAVDVSHGDAGAPLAFVLLKAGFC
jgi:hypothetical protein